MQNLFHKKYLRSDVFFGRMFTCQSLLVAAYPKRKGGY